MLVALLYAILYIAIVCAIGYVAKIGIAEFIAPMSATGARIATLLVGLFVFIACILVVIGLLSGQSVLPLRMVELFTLPPQMLA